MPGLARRLVTVAAAGLTVVLVAGCGSSLQEDQQGSADGPVKVGLLVPKSGVYAPLGRDMENGFRMYLDARAASSAAAPSRWWWPTRAAGRRPACPDPEAAPAG